MNYSPSVIYVSALRGIYFPFIPLAEILVLTLQMIAILNFQIFLLFHSLKTFTPANDLIIIYFTGKCKNAITIKG